MATYRLDAPANNGVFRTDPGNERWFPTDPHNADFIEYQQWLADGGVPDDPVTQPVPSPDWSWGPRLVDVIGG